MKANTPLLRAIAALVLLGGCAATPEEVPLDNAVDRVVPDLSGYWEVDFGRSEYVGDKLNYLLEVTRSHFNQMQRSDDARSYRAYTELQGVYDLGRLTELVTRPTVMTINQDSDDIVVERDGDYALLCDFLTTEITGNTLGRERCGWQGDQLVFEVALPDGLYVQHRFVLSDNGQRLNVATTLASQGVSQPFTINRVFMPFEPGEGMFDCEYTLAKKKTCRLRSDSE